MLGSDTKYSLHFSDLLFFLKNEMKQIVYMISDIGC